ncbi:sulfotransferase, putative [Gloeothece citriformis PCC 7424]|uniref:Sulfotransferase, putative n=1 Tax=Gloeothece citriformis (strain PCC 7424) TaxID=65393 RepID=B7K6S3_GLOC7|nr:sulfotransferase [Gloeothece citriformis]ACK72622.1 sulfotransferase, putative [Gloeothece citriformis PCC 7424]
MVSNNINEELYWNLFYLKNLFRDFKLLKSHLDYSKFIILGKGRSGSNFLRGLLNYHPNIIVFGELFRDRDSIGWEFPFYDQYLQSSNLISFMNKDPINFLEKKVFRRYHPQVLAVGFKLFYYHAQNDSRHLIWSYLKEQKTLKIIHLQRDNTLRELLSLRKAFKTNKWTNTDGMEEQEFSIKLEYEDCLQEFTHSQEIKAKYNKFFQDHQVINMIYENLSNDYETELKKLQDFLEVDYKPVKPLTYKQSKQPLKEAISNYYELKQKFQGTPWEAFFED